MRSKRSNCMVMSRLTHFSNIVSDKNRNTCIPDTVFLYQGKLFSTASTSSRRQTRIHNHLISIEHHHHSYVRDNGVQCFIFRMVALFNIELCTATSCTTSKTCFLKNKVEHIKIVLACLTDTRGRLSPDLCFENFLDIALPCLIWLLIQI